MAEDIDAYTFVVLSVADRWLQKFILQHFLLSEEHHEASSLVKFALDGKFKLNLELSVL